MDLRQRALSRGDPVDDDDTSEEEEETDDESEDEEEEDKPRPRPKYVFRAPKYGLTDLDIVGFIRNFVYGIYTILMIFVQIGLFLFETLFYFLTILYPFLVYLILIWFFWYLLIIYWPYVMQVIIVVFIPILNVLIILFNLFFMVALIILMIVITIWNAFVPFLGMILYVLINVISTILADIYNAIGSIDWEPIVAGFMQIINIIVEIAVQILVVLIKVGSEILMALAKIIGPILKILLTFVKILLPIVAWILKLLYYILSPILEILAAFFGGGNPNGARTKPSGTTARRLFSLGLAPVVLNQSQVPNLQGGQTVDLASMIPDGLSSDEKEDFERFLKSIGRLDTPNTDEGVGDFFTDTIREALDVEKSKPVMATGRKLFAASWRPLPRNNNLKFIDDVEEDAGDEHGGEPLSETHLDNAAHQIARQMYVSSKGLSSDDMSLAMDTMNAIMNEHRRQGDLSIQSTLREYGRKSKRYEPVIEETLASVHYDSVVEHPAKMYERFHNEARERRRQQFTASDASGRRLLENWKDVSEEKIAGLRIEHARAVLEQQKKYRVYQETHHKVVTVVYASVTKSLKNAFEEGITPSNVMKHWDSMLRSFGYKSMQEVRTHFENTHGNAVDFISAFSSISELPLFRYFKRADPTRLDSPYFHDWAVEQRKLKQDKEMMHGRRLHQMQYNQDRDVRGNGESKGALSGFATLSSLDCFSSPKNPLCIPNIPPGTQIRIPLIKLTKKQIEALNQDISRCRPWKLTYCIICLDRFYNAWQSFRWLLSAIPPINYSIATLTMQAPWSGVFFNWIFLVPKYHTTSFRQAICFANHLYDVFVTFVVLWFITKIVPGIYRIVMSTYRGIQANARVNKDRPWTDVQAQRLIERFALRYRNLDAQRQIGGSLRRRTRGEQVRDESTSVSVQLAANLAERDILLARQRYMMEKFGEHFHIDDRFDREHAKHTKKEIAKQHKRSRPSSSIVVRTDDDFE